MRHTDYDLIADRYAASRRRDLQLHGDPIFPYIEAGIAGCDVVIDAGCGSGEDLPRLALAAETVIGIDRSGAMLGLARAFVGPKIRLVQGDLRRLPLKTNCADAIISRFALQYLDNLDATYRDFARILRGEGTLVLLFPHPQLGDSKRKLNSDAVPLIDVELFDGSVSVRYPSYPLSHFLSRSFNRYFKVRDIQDFALGQSPTEPTAVGIRATKRLPAGSD